MLFLMFLYFSSLQVQIYELEEHKIETWRGSIFKFLYIGFILQD